MNHNTLQYKPLLLYRVNIYIGLVITLKMGIELMLQQLNYYSKSLQNDDVLIRMFIVYQDFFSIL